MRNLQMIKKFYGDIFIDKNKLSCEGIDYPIEVEYYKIYEDFNNKEKIEYGLEIIKKEYRSNDVITENKEITKITNEEKVINNILEKLKNNQVTPISVNYIIEDLTYNKEQKEHNSN